MILGLFFLLSGYFAKLVIERKGLRQFLWNRCLRIVLPFVLFYPFLLAAMTVVIVFSLSYLVEPRGLMGLIAAAAKDSSGAQKQEPLGTMHLWFLYYLMAFSAIGPLLSKLKWLKLEACSSGKPLRPEVCAGVSCAGVSDGLNSWQ